MKQIPLTQGYFALVDNEDYQWLTQYEWRIIIERHRYYYAGRSAKENWRKCILMHRVILNVPKGLQTDHINHNGLDNRKANLRIVTNTQNQYNQQPQRRNTSSRYKGVKRKGNRWEAAIKHNRKEIFIGSFINEIDAAKAYDKKATELFGEYAWLNSMIDKNNA